MENEPLEDASPIDKRKSRSSWFLCNIFFRQLLETGNTSPYGWAKGGPTSRRWMLTQHRHQQHGCHPALHLISGWVNLCSFVKEMCGVGRTFFSRAGASSVVMDGFQWTHFTMIDQKPFEYFTPKKSDGRMANLEHLQSVAGKSGSWLWEESSSWDLHQVWSCELVTTSRNKGVYAFHDIIFEKAALATPPNDW